MFNLTELDHTDHTDTTIRILAPLMLLSPQLTSGSLFILPSHNLFVVCFLPLLNIYMMLGGETGSQHHRSSSILYRILISIKPNPLEMAVAEKLNASFVRPKHMVPVVVYVPASFRKFCMFTFMTVKPKILC